MHMNAIVNVLSDAFDFVISYARELCAVLLVVTVFASANYLLHVAEHVRDAQRATINELIQSPAPATSAPATKACAWLKTDGTNTICASSDPSH
jgi:hypothetical protein